MQKKFQCPRCWTYSDFSVGALDEKCPVCDNEVWSWEHVDIGLHTILLPRFEEMNPEFCKTCSQVISKCVCEA